MPCTIKDVASRTGLSPSTVSRALNRSGYVSPETQQRVDDAVALLGYRPNWVARSLKGKPSRLIGLIIPDISNTYYTAIASAASSTLRAHDYELILCVNEEDPELDLHYLKILQQKRVDGILYTHPARGSNSEYVRELARGGLPIVELNRQREDDLLDAALANNFQGAYQMTAYLLGRGHRRIGLILGETSITTGHDRLEGYRRALADHGLPLDPDLVCAGRFNREHGEAATKQLLALANPPTVIFAGSNRILMGVLAALQAQDQNVPDDISVVAFDNSEWLSIWQPPITAVDVAVDEMARLAVELLLAQIPPVQPLQGFRRNAGPSEPHKPETHLLSTTMVERASCRDLTGAPHRNVIERIAA